MPNITFDFTTGVLPAGFTYTRVGVATYYDNTGTLQQAAANVPRFGYDPVTMENLGLITDVSSTNQSPNNVGVGVVTGSPGTMPAQWAYDGSVNGLTRTIVAQGIEKGVEYVDVRYAGTPLATGSIAMAFIGPNSIGSSGSQVWAVSAFLKLIAGSLAASPLFLCITATDGAVVLGDNAVAVSPTAADITKQRYFVIGNLSAFPTLTRVQCRCRADVTVGVPVDFTLRIGLTQLEAGSAVTSVMRVTGASFNRGNDQTVMTGAPFTAWFNPVEGTMVADFLAWNNTNGFLTSMNSGTTDNIRIQPGLVGVIAQINTGGVLQVNQSVTVPGRSPTQRLVVAQGYKLNDCNIACNGVLGVKDISCTIPACTNLHVAVAENNASGMNGSIRKLTYLANRVDDQALLDLTSDRQLWVGAVLVADKPAIRIVKT